MQTPEYTQEEARSRETFLAMMQGLSFPGRSFDLPMGSENTFMAIGETLLDLETSYFTPDEKLNGLLGQTGARALAPERAAYHFYTHIDENTLATIEKASVGTMPYPDEAATLIIACSLDEGDTLRLTGPGIKTETHIKTNVGTAFWQLRGRKSRYPLGWDVFLVDEARVIGLPRTTQIEFEGQE